MWKDGMKDDVKKMWKNGVKIEMKKILWKK